MVSKSSEAVISRPISLSSSMFFLPSLSDARQRLGRLGAEPRLGELRPLALLADHAAALDAGGTGRRESGQDEAPGIGPPRAIPGRQDRKRVGALVAHLAGEVASAHAEPEVAEAEIGVVAAGFIRPRRPVVVEAIEPRLVLHRPFAGELRGGELESQSVLR